VRAVALSQPIPNILLIVSIYLSRTIPTKKGWFCFGLLLIEILRLLYVTNKTMIERKHVRTMRQNTNSIIAEGIGYQMRQVREKIISMNIAIHCPSVHADHHQAVPKESSQEVVELMERRHPVEVLHTAPWPRRRLGEVD